MNEPTNEQKVWILELRHIQPSKTNPRTDFPKAKIEGLAESIRVEGVKTALWVRPLWCVGWDGKDVENRRPAADLGAFFVELEQPYELIAGECRYRGALLAERIDVPVQIYEVSDARAYEMQLIENLQRTDLNPVEEARGYRHALDLRENGRPLYTIESIAAKVNRSLDVIYERLRLLQAPKVALEAMLAGEISASTVGLLGRIPDETLRAGAAKRVLAGYGQGALTFRQTEELLSRDYIKSLAAAEFDPKAPALLPDAPACAECPHLMKNHPEFAKRPRAGDNCLNPACYQRKTVAAFEKFRELHAADGKRVLTLEENAQTVENDNIRTWSTNLVPLDERPSHGVLKSGANNSLPWRKLIECRGVEIVVARAGNGKAIEAVDLQAAIVAAKENGHQIFPVSTGAERKDHQAQAKKEAEAKKRREQVFRRIGKDLAKVGAAAHFSAVELLRLVLAAELRDRGNFISEFTGRKLKELNTAAASNEFKDVAGVALAVLVGQGQDWKYNFDSHTKDLLKRVGIDSSKMLRELVAEEQKKAKAAAAAAEAAEIAKNRPDPYVIPLPAGKRGAKITFDRKTLLFRVKDEPGQFEISPRTAFCLGWNDQREKKKRDLAKVPKWHDIHRIAYRIGSDQAVVKAGWPEMRNVETVLGGMIDRVTDIRKSEGTGLACIEKALKVDRGASAWLSDAQVDAKYAVKESSAATGPLAKMSPGLKKKVEKIVADAKGGAAKGPLAKQILAALEAADGNGLTVKELAEKVGTRNQNIFVWFATTGKKLPEIVKIGEGRYCHKARQAVTSPAAEAPPPEPPHDPVMKQVAAEILEDEAVNEIRNAGADGIAISALAKKIGYPEADVRRWWATNSARLREAGLSCSGGKFRAKEVEVTI